MNKKTIEELIKGFLLGLFVIGPLCGLIIYSMYSPVLSDGEYKDGRIAGKYMENIWDNTQSLHDVGEISDDLYYDYMNAYWAIMNAAYQDKTITVEMVKEYNSRIKELTFLDYDNNKLSKKKEYLQGLKDGINFEYYNDTIIYFYWKAEMIPEKIYKAYLVRRDAMYSNKATHENYAEFFAYTNNILDEYVRH